MLKSNMKSSFGVSSAAALLSIVLGGCAAIHGFPEPVADTKSELKSLQPFIGQDARDKYLAANDSARGA